MKKIRSGIGDVCGVWRIGVLFALLCINDSRSGVENVYDNKLLQPVGATDGVIPMINWGVVFHSDSMMINGASHFRSTIAVRLNMFNEQVAQMTLMPCATDQQKKFQCETFNKMITAVNTIARTRVKETIDRLNKIIQLIPEWTSTRPARRRRSAFRRYLKRLKQSPHVPAEHIHRIVKRGILSAFGTCFADMMNLPTKADIDTLKTHIDEIGKTVGQAKDELVRSEKELSNFRISSANALAKQMISIKDNANNIDRLRGDMIREEKEHQVLADQLDNELAIMDKYIDYLTELAMEKSVFTAGVEALVKRVDQFTAALRTLITGYLPEMLAEPDDVQKILDELAIDINVKYGGMFEITNKKVTFYYAMRDLAYARKGHDILIMLKIPIQHTGGPLRVYRMDTFPIYRSHDHHGRTLITDLPDYFAVTPQIDFYTEFTASYYDTCRGDQVKTCITQMSMQRQTSKVMSCAAALFYGDSKRIMQACTIKYIDRPPDPYKAIALSGSNYLIVGGDHKVDDDWKVSCPGAASSHNTRTIASCTMCVIDVPCFCLLTGRSLFIQMKLTGCRIPENKNFPDITYKYMFNLPSIHTTFPSELADKFLSDVTKINERPKFNFTKFHIIKSESADVIEAEDKIDADFKKTIEADHNHTVMWYTKAGKQLALSRDWSDLSNNKLNELSHTFSDFTDVLDAKSIMGCFSVGMIIGVFSFVCALFVLWKKPV